MKWAYIGAHTSLLERKKERKKGYFILTVNTRNLIMAVSSICNNSNGLNLITNYQKYSA
jgi:hypothetical protein